MCGDPSLQEAIKPDRTNPFRETEEEYDAERGERECKKWLRGRFGRFEVRCSLAAEVVARFAPCRESTVPLCQSQDGGPTRHCPPTRLLSPSLLSMGALERAATPAPVGSPPTAGVIIIIFEEKENDAQKI